MKKIIENLNKTIGDLEAEKERINNNPNKELLFDSIDEALDELLSITEALEYAYEETK
jgi:hypothetical protein